MKNEVIDNIISAEEKADSIIFDARVNSNNMMQEAIQNAERGKERIERKEKEFYRKLLEKEKGLCDKKYEDKLNRIKDKQKNIINISQENYDLALKILVSGVINGNRKNS